MALKDSDKTIKYLFENYYKQNNLSDQNLDIIITDYFKNEK